MRNRVRQNVRIGVAFCVRLTAAVWAGRGHGNKASRRTATSNIKRAPRNMWRPEHRAPAMRFTREVTFP